MPTKRLPKRLKWLRAHLRRVFGPERHIEAHAYAERVYGLERIRRRHQRIRKELALP